MCRVCSILLCLFLSLLAGAADYKGRVLDEKGEPVPFATVYLADNPVVGTATNNDGWFTLSTDAPASSQVIISFIGYAQYTAPLITFAISETPLTPQEARGLGIEVRLTEQPVALQEMVVAAKASRQKNKRKQMAQLLYKVYNRMQYDFPETNTLCQIVSDVRMNAEDTPWGMEQMVASVVNIPGQGRDGRDSVQFAPDHCKRFFQQQIRDRADTILAGDRLNADIRKMATEVDSGVLVHHALWAVGNIRYDFEQAMEDIRHWTVSNESEHETVLTHTEHKNYIGIFKYDFHRHYIVDSETFRVLRFSEDVHVELNIPFGYRFRKDDLELLNLLNMGEQQIEKFRLRHAIADGTLNTLYTMKEGHLYTSEKNLSVKATLDGTKKMSIPVDVRATQHATSIRPDVSPLPKSRLQKRVRREIVAIY